MNILPKKRWHVRTRENIARVRRDEAEAANDEKTRKARSQKAETEARINLLREKTRARYNEGDETMQNDEIQVQKEEHVNLFLDVERGKIDHHKPNVDHEAETKAQKEKYEQQIGYLTYLGQNINASKNNRNWYDDLPRRFTDKEPEKEIQESQKNIADPITDIKRYISIKNSGRPKNQVDIQSTEILTKMKSESKDKNSRMVKFNKRKRDTDKSTEQKLVIPKRSQSQRNNSHHISIEKLRDARLLREKTEKLRTEALLASLHGELILPIKREEPKTVIRQKYNSQYFPEIARQNAAMTP